jgi:hypothetical protein
MKTSVTLTFTALFIAVGAIYLYYGSPLPKSDTPAVPEKGSLKLLDLEKDAITLIQIQKPGSKETVTIEKVGEDWMLKYPVNYLADKMMVEGLSAALRVSNKARRLVREKGWEEYGLLKPDLKIGIEAKGLAKRKYLLLGDPSPVAAMIFARWEDEADYFLLDARFRESFDRSIYSLREKKLVRLSLNDLQKIRARTFKGNYELSFENKTWVWTEPVARIGKEVPREQMYEVLLSLRDLYAKEFLDGHPVNETERGFSMTGPFVQVWDKNEKTSVVRIGNEVTEHDAYYGMIEGETIALEIARGNIQKFFSFFDAISALEKAPAPAAMPSAAPSKEAADLDALVQSLDSSKG